MHWFIHKLLEPLTLSILPSEMSAHHRIVYFFIRYFMNLPYAHVYKQKGVLELSFNIFAILYTSSLCHHGYQIFNLMNFRDLYNMNMFSRKLLNHYVHDTYLLLKKHAFPISYVIIETRAAQCMRFLPPWGLKGLYVCSVLLHVEGLFSCFKHMTPRPYLVLPFIHHDQWYQIQN